MLLGRFKEVGRAGLNFMKIAQLFLVALSKLILAEEGSGAGPLLLLCICLGFEPLFADQIVLLVDGHLGLISLHNQGPFLLIKCVHVTVELFAIYLLLQGGDIFEDLL
jgi:hypothetical protein